VTQQNLSPLEQAHLRDLESQARLEKIMRKPVPRPKKKPAATEEATESKPAAPQAAPKRAEPKAKGKLSSVSADQRWQLAKDFANEKAIQAGEYA
jgi:hypothetical protein